MAKVSLCPVCNGNGQVSSGFYSHPGDWPHWVSSGANAEVCQSCQGKGWVIVPDDIQQVSIGRPEIQDVPRV